MLETLRFRDMNQYCSRLLLNGVILLLVWCGCVLAQEMSSDKLSVFAAASLKPSLDKITPLFEKKYGVKLVLSFAGSGALARQIEYGAPADVFISANESWLHHLEKIGLIRDSTALFSNALVLIENSKINHKGNSSVDEKHKDEIEINRNWHLMWSTFYFYKKHFGTIKAFVKILPKFSSAFLKFIIFFLINNKKKRDIYYARFNGSLNSIIGKKSWYRPKITK